MSQDPVERYAGNRTPPRPPEIRVGSSPGGAPAKTTVTIKFDGTRGTGATARCYTGHVLGDDGVLGAACQFVIDNDPGTDTMPANFLVTAEPAPPRLADASIWTNSTTKYRVVSTAPLAMVL